LNGVVKECGGKGTLIFSNVPGFLSDVKFLGGSYTSVFYTGGGIGSASNFASIFSCDGRMSICFQAETGNVPDIEEIKRMLNERIDKLGIADE
jgi:hypothetical protein